MSSPQSVTLHILDKEYRVSCPPEERDNLLESARYLDEKMREVKEGNVLGTDKIAVMAALNICHELIQARQSLSRQDTDLSRVSTLLDRVQAELDACNK